MQKITLVGIKAAARWAYEGARLTAQSEAPLCIYQYVSPTSGIEFNCAAGAVFDKATMNEVLRRNLNRQSSINRLIDNKLIDVDPDELEMVQLVQGKHDDWARAVACYDATESRKAHNEFLELIYS